MKESAVVTIDPEISVLGHALNRWDERAHIQGIDPLEWFGRAYNYGKLVVQEVAITHEGPVLRTTLSYENFEIVVQPGTNQVLIITLKPPSLRIEEYKYKNLRMPKKQRKFRNN